MQIQHKNAVMSAPRPTTTYSETGWDRLQRLTASVRDALDPPYGLRAVRAHITPRGGPIGWSKVDLESVARQIIKVLSAPRRGIADEPQTTKPQIGSSATQLAFRPAQHTRGTPNISRNERSALSTRRKDEQPAIKHPSHHDKTRHAPSRPKRKGEVMFTVAEAKQALKSPPTLPITYDLPTGERIPYPVVRSYNLGAMGRYGTATRAFGDDRNEDL